MAIKAGKPFVIGNMENDPKFKVWKKNALKRGYSSSIAVPLVYEKKAIGAINIYSEIEDAFGDEEINFFMEVAGDIAIGIRSIRLKGIEGNIKRQRNPL